MNLEPSGVPLKYPLSMSGLGLGMGLVLALAALPSAQAALLIGAGSSLTGGTLADSGPRTNVDRNFRYLPAGTYHVNDFNFNGVAASGTVQPFLSTLSGTQHTPVWAGPAQAPVTGPNNLNYTGGSQQFTLAVPTRIYSGFSMTAASVGFAGGGSTDHNGSALTPVPGTQFANFTNNNLGRTYASGLNVTSANPLTGGKAGGGAGIAGAQQQDTPGENRLNVDLLFITLSPGTYQVSNWELNVYDHAQPGTITPMLLTRAGNGYTTLWLGGDLDPTANGPQTFSETGMFTLAATTEVYAGFFTEGNGSGIIALDSTNAGAGNMSLTDHDSSFTAPVGTGASVEAFSNAAIARTYAFGINMAAIPEPGSAGLLLLGGLAALTRRRQA